MLNLRPGERTIIAESLKDTGVIGVLGVAAFLLLRWVAPISVIPSESMAPTIDVGDRILVNNFQRDSPDRGDIVVFDSGYRTGFLQEKVLFVKRVVGLSGENIEIKEGIVLINGNPLDEPYAVPDGADFPLTKIPPGAYFLLGDNRGHSSDSRTLGAISQEAIEGRVAWAVWPPGDFKAL